MKPHYDTPFAPFATDTFPWQMNALAPDDFVCKIGDYVLRVEQMDKGHWWWRVYYKDEALPEATGEFASRKYQAIGLAEGMSLGHALANRTHVK